MLKFAKHYMESIEGVATYPIISLVIFFVFFVALFYWVATASKAHIAEMAGLPLDNKPEINKQP